MPEWLGRRSLKGRPDSFDLSMTEEEGSHFAFAESKLKGSIQANAKILWELRQMYRPGECDILKRERQLWRALVTNKRCTQRQKLWIIAVSSSTR